MQSFKNTQSVKILSCYDELDIIKGGKPAMIGEIREHNGIKYIKHADGWVYVKQGKTKIQKDAQSEAKDASEEHHKYYLETVEKDLPEFKKENKVPKLKVRRTLATNHATKEIADKYKSLSKHVLEISKPIVQEILLTLREKYKEAGKEFKNDERQLMKIGTTYEILSTITSYLDENDKIIDYDILSDQNRIEAHLLIERNGKEHQLSTEIVYAGGYNVQQLHTRYIVKSNLKKKSKDIFSEDNLSPELKELAKEFKAVDKINISKKNINKAYAKKEEAIDIRNSIQEASANFLNRNSPEHYQKAIGEKFDRLFKGGFQDKDMLKRYQTRYKEWVGNKLEAISDKTIDPNSVNLLENSDKLLGHLIYDLDSLKRFEENKIYDIKATSTLPAEIKETLSIEDFDWSSATKTFTSNYKFKTPKVKDGNSTTYVNWENKTIKLKNPKSDKIEIFDFVEKIDSLRYKFKSKSGLFVVLK